MNVDISPSATGSDQIPYNLAALRYDCGKPDCASYVGAIPSSTLHNYQQQTWFGKSTANPHRTVSTSFVQS